MSPKVPEHEHKEYLTTGNAIIILLIAAVWPFMIYEIVAIQHNADIARYDNVLDMSQAECVEWEQEVSVFMTGELWTDWKSNETIADLCKRRLDIECEIKEGRCLRVRNAYNIEMAVEEAREYGYKE